MRKLIIVRGLPGSGKTTFAKMLATAMAGIHRETDMFFVDKNGVYRFDASKIREAHEWCQREVKHLMEYGHPIVVSNTFTQEWEMQFYLNCAKQYGYEVTSIIVENRHGNASVHDVPGATIQKMKDRFEVSL